MVFRCSVLQNKIHRTISAQIAFLQSWQQLTQADLPANATECSADRHGSDSGVLLAVTWRREPTGAAVDRLTAGRSKLETKLRQQIGGAPDYQCLGEASV